ncbi:hypothetical protein D3C79_997860 [compost metagenome]
MSRCFQQRKRLLRLQRHACSPGKIIGSPQWHEHQACLASDPGHGLGDITQGAVSTAGCNMPVTTCLGFVDQPRSITGLPGQANVKLPATLAQRTNGGTYLLVHGLLAMQDE